MIRRILDFVYVLLFVWACIFLGLWIIKSLIVPFEIVCWGLMCEVLTAILKVVFSFLLVLLWLWLWKEIARKMFWRTMKRKQSFINTRMP